MKKDYEQIELRSEKVGRIPPLLIRCGITIITVLLASLAVVGYFYFSYCYMG